jgi:acyl carrier protein
LALLPAFGFSPIGIPGALACAGRRACTAMLPAGPAVIGEFCLANDHDQICSRILEFIRSEIQDKTVEFDMDTPIEIVKIDSIDVIHVIFKVEEEYNVVIDLPQDSKFATIGDFVRALAEFVPAGQG